MHCYHCKTTELKPKKLEYGLPALSCEQCDGTYLDLLTYRAWREEVAKREPSMEVLTADVEEVPLANSERALVCQRCQKFMLKYRINNEQENTLNVCHTCDDVWLDQGEWQLLKRLALQDQLTEVMSEPWQSDLRKQEKAAAFRKHFQSQLGEDFERVEAFAVWLDDHPNKAQVLHYLMYGVE